MNISPIATEQVDGLWNKIKYLFDKVAPYSYGRFTGNDIRTSLKNNKAQQLFIAHEGETIFGMVITEVVEYPQMRSLVMHHTAGDNLMEWKDDMLKTLQQYAQLQGCEVIESKGRDGWEKIFKDDGFKKVFIAYELPVESN